MPKNKIQIGSVEMTSNVEVIYVNSRLCMRAAKCCWLADNLLKSLTGAEAECDELYLTEEICEFLKELCRALEGNDE